MTKAEAGRLGGLKGGLSKTDKKRTAAHANLVKAREALAQKRESNVTTTPEE